MWTSNAYERSEEREREIEYSFLIHTFRNSRRSLKSYIHFLRLKILFLGVKRVYFGWLWKKCFFFQSIYDGLKLDTIWGRKYKSFRNVNIVRVTRLLRIRWTLHVICMPIKWCDQKKTFSVKLMEKTPYKVTKTTSVLSMETSVLLEHLVKVILLKTVENE